MIEIREATAIDIPVIKELASKVWFVTYGPLQPKDKVDYLFKLMYSDEALREQMQQKNHKFLLTKDDTGYLGYASYEHNYKGENKTKIHKIYVMPDAQGKGVGREIIFAIESMAQQANAPAFVARCLQAQSSHSVLRENWI
ncbi:MAG: GNAT family N-acetyltransferase [Cyclobacteriaceae bacterium]